LVIVPLFDVVAAGDDECVSLGEHLGKRDEEGHNQLLDKDRLHLGDISRVAVAVKTDVKALGLLHISLLKELLKEQIAPLLLRFERPGSLRHGRSADSHL
jgi:hypothetical protein